MAQTIIAYIIIGLAVFYAIRSVVRKFKKNASSCGSSCCGCSVKNCGKPQKKK